MAVKLCLEPRCGDAATYRGRCPTHSRNRERETHRNKGIYGSKRWQMTRRHQLMVHPLCAECGRIASDVDHITPIEQGGGVWSPDNLQSLCGVCHGRKTRREQA